ncbi:DUF6193 family natural product biosynthesis protein [Nonomuraea sp. NPDC049714]|uniref:DUF6193 family natural product biosynthesis protein n=1 Tax=Nonomuraea sp. NPDC049714 TaxID=3364357 RepID=UPI003794D7F5
MARASPWATSPATRATRPCRADTHSTETPAPSNPDQHRTGRRSGRYGEHGDLIEAAYVRPRLRQFFPYTGLWSSRLSTTRGGWGTSPGSNRVAHTVSPAPARSCRRGGRDTLPAVPRTT